ncbi:MAG: hypothetical protein AB7I01_11195 [Gammaproteobacteria bacterium]
MRKAVSSLGVILAIGAIAGCIEMQAPYAETYVVSGARFTAESAHARNRALIGDGEKPESGTDFVLQGHQVRSGDGSIVAFREQSPGSILRTDRSSFWNLTVFFPQMNLGTANEIRLDSRSDVFAFWSSSLTNSPGSSGCWGYSKSGSVTLQRASDGLFTLDVDLMVDTFSPLNWPGDCEEEKRIRRRVTAHAQSLSKLIEFDRAVGIGVP